MLTLSLRHMLGSSSGGHSNIHCVVTTVTATVINGQKIVRQILQLLELDRGKIYLKLVVAQACNY